MTEEKKSGVSAATVEKQEKILNALQAVLDPELGLSVIDLDLIREVNIGPEEAEIRMLLTTPFCPYGPALINQIQAASSRPRRCRSRSPFFPTVGRLRPGCANLAPLGGDCDADQRSARATRPRHE